MDLLINENKNLKKSGNTQRVITYAASISSVILVVNPNTENNNGIKIKEGLKNNVDPSIIGTGIFLGKTTKKGGVGWPISSSLMFRPLL